MLFNYRLMNLCVKAEPAALMPVTVVLSGKDFNLEEVAETRRPDEYHFEIRPNNEKDLKDIINAIFQVHPEFILEMKSEKDLAEEEKKFLLYTMPEVNKDRYKLLNNLTRGFYDECAIHIDEAYAKEQLRFADTLLHAPIEEADEAKGELKSIYEGGKDETTQIRDVKLKEIEDAYQHYLEKHPEEDYEIEDEEPVHDWRKGYIMPRE